MEKTTQIITRESPIEKILVSISKYLAVIAAFTLFVMMAVIVIDVGGRYFFNRPLKGAIELVGLLLVIAATFGLGYCEIRKAHIRITILFCKFSPVGQLVLNILAYICCIAACFLVSWQTLLRAIKYLVMPQGNITEILEIPLFPVLLLLAFGFGWLLVIFIRDLYRLKLRR